MMRECPKKIKRLIREQAMKAHEEELRRALLPLAAAFDEWKAGKRGHGELVALIHDFHQGPPRVLYNKYNSRLLDAVVAHALATGILDKSLVPSELLEYLEQMMALYQNDNPDGTIT